MQTQLVYKECPSYRVIALVIAVTFFSALDALLTLLYITNGGVEINPFAAQLMDYGYTQFVSIKMITTGLGAWVLAALHHVMPAYIALHGIAALYILINLIHLLNWLQPGPFNLF